MYPVKVPKERLLEILHVNLKKHKAIFNEAIVNYRTAVIAELDKMLTDAKAGKRIERSLKLLEPIDQTREYIRQIAMLNTTSDTEILLSENEFKCYVLDEWHWRDQFLISNMRYSKTAGDTYKTVHGLDSETELGNILNREESAM